MLVRDSRYGVGLVRALPALGARGTRARRRRVTPTLEDLALLALTIALTCWLGWVIASL